MKIKIPYKENNDTYEAEIKIDHQGNIGIYKENTLILEATTELLLYEILKRLQE